MEGSSEDDLERESLCRQEITIATLTLTDAFLHRKQRNKRGRQKRLSRETSREVVSLLSGGWDGWSSWLAVRLAVRLLAD